MEEYLWSWIIIFIDRQPVGVSLNQAVTLTETEMPLNFNQAHTYDN